MRTNLLKIGWNLIIKLVLIPIQIYRYIISPILPQSCRFRPTCSEYAIEAVKVHGPIKGTYLTCRRLIRCNPFGSYGFDPVPKARERR